MADGLGELLLSNIISAFFTLYGHFTNSRYDQTPGGGGALDPRLGIGGPLRG